MTILKFLPDEYYKNLLTSEYKQSFKFLTWMQTVLNILTDVSNCLAMMDYVFDLDYAKGVQLDTLGVIVGASRNLPFTPTNPLDNPLSDDSYRLLIRATIANNDWDGNINSLYSIWNNLFSGGKITIIDNQDMTANIILTGSFSPIIQDLINHGMIVPRPETVAYNYSFGGLPMFGFDRNDSFIAGFDVGKWS